MRVGKSSLQQITLPLICRHKRRRRVIHVCALFRSRPRPWLRAKNLSFFFFSGVLSAVRTGEGGFSAMKGSATGGGCWEGKAAPFAVPPAPRHNAWETRWHWALLARRHKKCCSCPKMWATCRKGLRKRDELREHKAASTSKVNLRSAHFCCVTHTWQWFWWTELRWATSRSPHRYTGGRLNMKIAEYDIWDYLSNGCGEVDLYLLYEEAALSPAPDLTPPPLFFFFLI